MTSDEIELEKIKIASQILQSYINRPKDASVRDEEWKAIVTVCEFLRNKLK